MTDSVVIVLVSATRRSILFFFFFQAEDGIRDLVRSRGLGDVYKRQRPGRIPGPGLALRLLHRQRRPHLDRWGTDDAGRFRPQHCLLYTSDAADERSSVDLGGRRIIKQKKTQQKKKQE